MTDHDFENRLRASLATHAGDAPRSDDVERRILSAALIERAPRRFRWRTFGAPLVAAGAVAAVVAALVGIEHDRPSATKQTVAPATQGNPAPTVFQSTVAPTPQGTSTAVNAVGLVHFSVVDLTWVGPNDGWAIGTADCATGSGRCTAMARTSDGSTWRSATAPPVNVADDCANACATNIRFANDRVGYVYGMSTFFMTTDGGTSWAAQAGGAYALETLDGNVIRLVADHGGCPGPCNLRVQLSAIGATTWTTVTLPGGTVDTGTVTLLRTGNDAFISTASGHAGSLTPRLLYVSTDDGRTWSRKDDACTTLGESVTTGALAAADGSLSLACWNQSSFVILTSRDAGADFARGPSSGYLPVAAVSTTTFLGVASGGIYRSVDRGGTWHRVLADSTNGSTVCGFETPTVGRCTSNDRKTIWTTDDAGANWTATTFS